VRTLFEDREPRWKELPEGAMREATWVGLPIIPVQQRP
jgi:hypothetical protein